MHRKLSGVCMEAKCNVYTPFSLSSLAPSLLPLSSLLNIHILHTHTQTEWSPPASWNLAEMSSTELIQDEKEETPLPNKASEVCHIDNAPQTLV